MPAHVDAEDSQCGDLERITTVVGVDRARELARFPDDLAGTIARQRLDHSRSRELQEAAGKLELVGNFGAWDEQAVGHELMQQRLALHGIHAEVLAQVTAMDARALRRETDHARQDARRGRAHVHRIHAEVKPLRYKRPFTHDRYRPILTMT